MPEKAGIGYRLKRPITDQVRLSVHSKAGDHVQKTMVKKY
jgi:hypothetical protein